MESEKSVTIGDRTVPVAKFIRNKITGDVLNYNPHALVRSENDYEPFDGVVTDTALPEDAGDVDAADRIAKIKAIIASLPEDAYGKPFGGKPAMPTVAAVSEAVGFKVAASEIEQAMAEA